MRKGKSTEKLLPCPFCGEAGRLIVQTPEYGTSGAWVECAGCRSRGRMYPVCETHRDGETKGLYTPVTPAGIAYGTRCAVQAWNQRKEQAL